MTDRSAGGFDAGDRTRLAERQRRRRAAEQRDDADLAWLMARPEGRRFVRRLLGLCHLYESSFTGTEATFFREGERNVGLQLLAEIVRLCPEQHARMLTEQHEET
jgi:hypothetical protein